MDRREDVLLELNRATRAIDADALEGLCRRIAGAGRIFCEGAGRSSLAMQGFSMRLMQLGLRSSLVGEATTPAFQPGDLLLVCSASGNSARFLEHARLAKKLCGDVGLLTTSLYSALLDLSDSVIIIPAPSKNNTEKTGSIQPMGTLFEQTAQVACDVMVLRLMELLPATEEKMRSRHANLE
jgi:6-phospho-3-hexuloisomerase